MYFVESFKIIMIFEVIAKKIHVIYKIYAKNLNFYCICKSQ
jgi:hypothetical protein